MPNVSHGRPHELRAQFNFVASLLLDSAVKGLVENEMLYGL